MPQSSKPVHKSRQRPETATHIKTHALMQTLTCIFAVVMHQLLIVLLVSLWMTLRGLDGGVLPDVIEPPLQLLYLRRKPQTAVVLQYRLYRRGAEKVRVWWCCSGSCALLSNPQAQLLDPPRPSADQEPLQQAVHGKMHRQASSTECLRRIETMVQHSMPEPTWRRNQGAIVASTRLKSGPRKKGPASSACPSSQRTSAVSFSAHSACCCLSCDCMQGVKSRSWRYHLARMAGLFCQSTMLTVLASNQGWDGMHAPAAECALGADWLHPRPSCISSAPGEPESCRSWARTSS